MSATEPLAFLGNPASPYTRKMLALLRYRRIPHRVIWGSHMAPPEGLPQPKVKLLPTFYFPTGDGALDAVVDSTQIARRLEREHAGRSAVPDDPELAFYAALIEDYADEWLTKPMFHYRWHHEADRVHAGKFLAYLLDPSLAPETAESFAATFTKRQYDRLYVVGSNDRTAAAIEASYARFIALLDTMLDGRPFVLGNRPCIADFAIYGQMTQLGLVDPTPRALMLKHTPRLEAWLWRLEDLSALEPDSDGWIDASDARDVLAPLFDEIGKTYLPVLLANAAAADRGQEQFTAEVDGCEWAQPTFPYQAKCLADLRSHFSALSVNAKAAVAATMTANGCAALIEEQT